MLVTISEAARMVGIKSRSTFYRHIEKKGITTTTDEEGNPKIDTSELIRVYGDKVKLPGTQKSSDTPNTPKTKQVKQDHTPSTIQVEIQVLREKIKLMEDHKNSHETERKKERELLNDQIETLRDALGEAQDQQKRLTTLITDQRKDKTGREDLQEKRIESLESMVQSLKAQNDELLKMEKERRERAIARRKQKEEQEQAERKRQEQEKNKSFFAEVFGAGGS